MYDYLLGGGYNFAVDRDIVERLLKIVPDAEWIVRSHREFLGRVVRYCMRRGIEQFIDLGSGVPTGGHVHTIAQQMDPRARVVYVDNEPIAVESTRKLLADNDRAEIVQADFLEPEKILESEQSKRLLDLSRPVALLAIASLHYVSDADDLNDMFRVYLSAMSPGSCLAIAHFTTDDSPFRFRGKEFFARVGLPMTVRTRSEIEELFEDSTELVEPGVVYVPQWRPEVSETFIDDPKRSVTYGAVGFKLS